MEVVCLIVGPMLASQPCSHAFWVLTSLHLLSFLLKMLFIILVIVVIIDVVHVHYQVLLIDVVHVYVWIYHVINYIPYTVCL